MSYRAERDGDLRMAKRIMAILAVSEGERYLLIASILNVCVDSIRRWVNTFLLKGIEGLKSKKSPGRKPKLTKNQKNNWTKLLRMGLQNLVFQVHAGGLLCYSTL